MEKIIGKDVYIKNIIALLFSFICLLLSGCGDSSKEQIIVVYDCSKNTEKEYDYTNETLDDLINQISDFFLDGERKTDEIPKEALEYKIITVFQPDKKKTVEQQKTDDSKIINIEIYQYNDEFYCKACFSYAEQEYSSKLSDEISEQVKMLEIGQ